MPGRYVIGKLLTQGSQSRVYKAFDRFENKPCIIKSGEGILSEALCARELTHPFIAQPYDLQKDDEIGLYSVYQPIGGKNLSETWATLTAVQRKAVIRNIADVLAFLHHRGF